MRVGRQLARGLLIGAVTSVLATSVVSAVSRSTNYQVDQTELGGSSSLNTCSTTYCAQSSTGGISSSGGTNGTMIIKPVPGAEGDPSLNVSVQSTIGSLGTLTTDRTAAKTMTVQVQNYLSNGYVLQIIGDPPHYNGHTLTALTTPSTSQIGKEQFGINVVKNTSPVVGEDPTQMPTDDISFGEAAPNYNVADKFMYQSGDVVGLSRTASGATLYTISIIVNVSSLTPAGQYSGDFSAVVIPIY